MPIYEIRGFEERKRPRNCVRRSIVADLARSRAARAASEQGLLRVVHHYGARPEFVVLGGLVPELLCADSGRRHAGTTDVDVQVDLEVACGAVNTARLENALRNAEFEPDASRVWRWVTDGIDGKTVVKFELLADLDSAPNEATVRLTPAHRENRRPHAHGRSERDGPRRVSPCESSRGA